jgi:hypothetical protein
MTCRMDMFSTSLAMLEGVFCDTSQLTASNFEGCGVQLSVSILHYRVFVELFGFAERDPRATQFRSVPLRQSLRSHDPVEP